jgi:hypothetical protein
VLKYVTEFTGQSTKWKSTDVIRSRPCWRRATGVALGAALGLFCACCHSAPKASSVTDAVEAPEEAKGRGAGPEQGEATPMTAHPDGTSVIEAPAATRPGECPLFHHLLPDRAGGSYGCLRNAVYADDAGRYFYFDLEKNVVIVLIANVRGLPEGTKDATPDEATLCPGSAFEMRVRPKPNSLTVVLPDLTQHAFPWESGAARALGDCVHAYPKRPYAVVGSVLDCLGDGIDPELSKLLQSYR